MDADDLIVVSVDDHICEPADMFANHVPQRYPDRAPRVVEEESGTLQWYYGDLRGRNLGLNAVAGKSPEMFNVDPTRYEEMRAGCYDVHERVRDMSAGGQLAGLSFPNWTGFSGQVLNAGPDRDVNLVMIKAYNDWHVHEWCGAYPDRFIPCGILPLFDVTAAAGEARRLAGIGCHAVTFSENPAGLGMPSIHSGERDPLFAACCDVALPVRPVRAARPRALHRRGPAGRSRRRRHGDTRGPTRRRARPRDLAPPDHPLTVTARDQVR